MKNDFIKGLKNKSTCKRSYSSVYRMLFAALFIFCMNPVQIAFAQTYPELPNPPANIETLPDGSIVVPMDHLLQNNYDDFDIRAYGLVNRWLHVGIPVKWVIKKGKEKDGIDFTANAERISPTAIAADLVGFRGAHLLYYPSLPAAHSTLP